MARKGKKMNKHEEARKSWNKLQPILSNKLFDFTGEQGNELVICMNNITEILTQSEATEKELEGMKKDVKRYFILDDNKHFENNLTCDETKELLLLYNKLSKVGIDK